MRRTYVFRKDDAGQWYSVEAEKAPPKERSAAIVEDTMTSTWHPADGKYYDSKSRFRATTKAYGCVELGNDLKTKDGGFRGITSKPRQESVKETISRAARGEIGRVRN